MKGIIETARRELGVSGAEAELIVATLLDRPRFEVYYNASLSPADRAGLRLRLKQLKRGVPLEYVTKRVRFLDRSLSIQPGIFIPRLETEYFIELIRRLIPEPPRNILEIGTGCGAIAIALTDVFPQARIVATDISGQALATARENIERFDRSDRIDLVRASLFNGLSGRYDLIVSNPPYIPVERLPDLPRSVREFEPIRALCGGPGGIRFIRAILDESPRLLEPGGLVGLEIDEESTASLTDCVKRLAQPFSFHPDLFGCTRYFFLGETRHEKRHDHH